MFFRRILLVLALSSAAGTAARAAGATISGTVSDSGSGSPLSGMTVAAYTLAGFSQATATTDAQGRYLLSLPGATYRVLAYDLSGIYATSFYPSAESFDTSAGIVVAASQTLTSINLALSKGGRLAGKVTAGSGGSPLAGMTVAAYNLDGTQRGRTSTDGAGSYSIVLPPGTYKTAAYDETLAYALQFYSGQLNFGAASTLSVVAPQTVSGIDFALASAAKFSGTVLDRASRAALPGITVAAYDLMGNPLSSVVSDASGRFAMALPPGSYRFAAFDSSGFYLTSYYRDASDFAAAASFSLSAGQTVTGIEFDLSAGPTVFNATTLCLNNCRFKVQTQWTTRDGHTGAGQAVPLTTDTGYFWFFSSNNVEMVVKVVYGCSFNSRYWTFAGGLTDVNVVMTVTDTQTGAVRTYVNPQGSPFAPIQDTSAFATCP